MLEKEKLSREKHPWWALGEKYVFEALQADDQGLTTKEAETRYAEFGANTLPGKKKASLFKIILRQIMSPIIYVLLVAVVFSIFIGDTKDAFFIIAIIVINTAIGTFQEWKAEKSSEALQSFLQISSRVLRDGEDIELNADHIVPGDIVLLESGEKIPADLRIISANSLTIDESIITGESVAVNKNTMEAERDAELTQRHNMAFAGSMVNSGRGVGIVVGTGLNTEIGKLAEAITQLETTQTPLVKRFEQFSKEISIVVLVVCCLLGIMEIFRGKPLQDVVYLAIALAVSVIPEALPATLTAALSIGMNRMAKRHVIIRELPAVEGLGSCTCIASDKTGTLTLNKQTAKRLYMPNGDMYKVTGEGYSGEGKIFKDGAPDTPMKRGDTIDELIKVVSLVNEADLEKESDNWESKGDTVDIALLALGFKIGYDPNKMREETEIIHEIPFESENKYAAMFYKEDGKTKVAIKGALETILNHCDKMQSNGKTTEIDKDALHSHVDELAENGYRVISAASGFVDIDNPEEPTLENIRNLTFLGSIGLIDPIRPEAKDAIDKCRSAGIEVLMITGDHAATAFSIAKELGIASDRREVITGEQLDKVCNFPNYCERVSEAKVFARVNPLQKLNIVGNLLDKGHFVAVTGDGVNDAPALKKASISVAMGSGADVAKEVASIIVTDDNFASIVSGVEEGRFTYDNIRKCVYLLLTTGASQIILFFLVIVTNLEIPFSPVQLLWLNLATSGIQGVGLAFEGGEEIAMKRPPRNPKEGIFNDLMFQEIAVAAVTTGIVAYIVWTQLLGSDTLPKEQASNLLLLLMVLFSNFHVFNCRSEYTTLFKIPLNRNYFLVISVIMAQLIHIAAMHTPFMQPILDVGPITLNDWLYLLAFAPIVWVSMEIFKFVKFSKRMYLAKK